MKIGFALLIAGCHLLFSAVPDSVMTIGTNFWDQAWGGADPWKNGYQNAVIPAHINDVQYNPWKPEFLDEISFYSVLRFMDYGRINNNRQEVYWRDRVRETEVNQGRMALYWMIDLCNRVKADLWVCMPERATADYWRGAAELIKEKLDSSLKVYLEWSNETWNPQFSAYQTAIDSGKVHNLWFPGDQGQSWGEGRLAGRYAAFINIRLWATFESVFKTDFNDRVICVLAGAAENDWWDAVLAHALIDRTVNPSLRMPHVFAIAPYISIADGGAADATKQMTAELTKTEQTILRVRSVLNGKSQWSGQIPPHPGLNNIPLVCYEAGQHIVNNSAAFAANPAAYVWYMDYLALLKKYIKGPVAHYTHSGAWGNMAWGAKNEIGQPGGQAPKFMALYNWFLDHAQPAPGEKISLTINNGSGGGSFLKGYYVFVDADPPASSQVFDRWQGDTSRVANPREPKTVVQMGDRPLTLTAVYKPMAARLRLEAEGAVLNGVRPAAARPGYSGSGYVDGSTFDADADSISFQVNVAHSGSYLLRIGYGGFYGEKYQYIHVNAKRLAYFHFPAASAWRAVEFGAVDLHEGVNVIAIVKSWGWMDVDYIELEGRGLSAGVNVGAMLPDELRLDAIYPNPFNDSTVIGYSIPQFAYVSLSVYNLTGQLVDRLVADHQAPGRYRVQWTTGSKTLASGRYFLELKAGRYRAIRSVVLLR
jgi:hypothetical protein